MSEYKTLQENQTLNLEYQRNKELRELKQEIERLNNIINETIKYCNNTRVTLKSQYFINVVKLLKGEKIDE